MVVVVVAGAASGAEGTMIHGRTEKTRSLEQQQEEQEEDVQVDPVSPVRGKGGVPITSPAAS